MTHPSDWPTLCTDNWDPANDWGRLCITNTANAPYYNSWNYSGSDECPVSSQTWNAAVCTPARTFTIGLR